MNRFLRALAVRCVALLGGDAAGGVVLLLAALVALALANSPLAPAYHDLLHRPLSLGVGGSTSLMHIVNDGLMAIFFLSIGMELKRELLHGHLASRQKAALPAIAAAGGMIVPALFYLAINRNGGPAALRGWAVPTATDIAFALGCLALLGRRVPPALKAFLLSVAVFDDLGAILIIAGVYTAYLSFPALAAAGLILVVLATMNVARVRFVAAYLFVGIGLWWAVLASGIHATVAGATLAMFIPLQPGHQLAMQPSAPAVPRLERVLGRLSAFVILPLFALANAGVSVAGMGGRDLLAPVPLGIIVGLCLGKPIGIAAACWIATRCRVAALPAGVSWSGLVGVATLCGIGFTMSLFIASLAFEPASGGREAGAERLALLLASAVAGIVGTARCAVALRRKGPGRVA